MGLDLGGAVKGFKDGMKDGGSAGEGDVATPPPSQVANQAAVDKTTIDVEAFGKKAKSLSRYTHD